MRAAAALLAFVSLASSAEPDFPRFGDELYQPRLRQPGKDVMWLPTPDVAVRRMLEVARTGKDDLVFDLGAGDGRIAIAAAKIFGARAVGIEYEAPMAALAERNARRAGVADKVRIVHGDIFKEDFSAATVITLYLLPELNQQLRPRILDMRPGTRVVSYRWDMGEWEPDETIRESEGDVFSWIVPVNVAGRWRVRDERGFIDADIEIEQRFQRIGGTIVQRGKRQPLLGAYVQGEYLGFTFVHQDGGIRSVRARVTGQRLDGKVRFAGDVTPIHGVRR